MTQLSSLSIQLQSVETVQRGQNLISNLARQLSTGKRFDNISEYLASESKQLLDLRNTIDTRAGFGNVIKTVKSRLELYDKSLAGLEDMGNQALRLITQSSSSTTANTAAIGQQVEGFLDDFSFYLNQRLGDRYLFSGTRFNTSPVGDLKTLPLPPTDTLTTSPVLPRYDTEFPASNAQGFIRDRVTIDESFTVSYGITSNDQPFQQLALGLRWAQAAAQDPTNFTAYMATAESLISAGLTGVRAARADVAANSSTLTRSADLHNDLTRDATNRIQEIEEVDINEVATKLSFSQTQLQASFSATGILAKLSIVNFL